MEQTYSIKKKMKQLAIILFPILVTQVGLYAMNFFDTVMSGHASSFDLAGVAIGSSLWVPVFTGLSGVLLAITPIVSQLLGANKENETPATVIQGTYVSIFFSIVIIIVGALAVDPILRMMSLEPDVARIAKGYLFGLSFGIIPLFVYTVLRCFIDALGHTRVTMIITLLALPINVFFNYVLIFGKFGFPQLGGIGAGYATAITYWFIAFITIYIIDRKNPFSVYRIFRTLYPVSFKAWKAILIIGVPIGLAIFLETSIFAAVTLFMSTFDTTTIASHQAALNFASALYMVPLSISMALTILIGFEVGAKRYKDAKQYGYIGIGFSIMMSLLCGFLLFLFKEQIAGLYTTDQAVLYLTQQFLIYAVFFQLSDGIASPIQGALRGYKDVNSTFYIAIVSYWIIGLPLGYLLATFTTLGAFGYWLGLIAGLAAGAIALTLRLMAVQKRYTSLS
ncbi:MATE family efflux transporter [Bacillus horti]|uniref:Probable multidrug resistance protein NorM n=1 Tax=Caldalkalibacillus horti TaxID=77523 RepID=A0ABT9VX04_9BACI|nr:MATE family efflux transporter [Bacillus horti]MDQ0165523.1 MATE family multidrug resistance protein [Bacillus horti]